MLFFFLSILLIKHYDITTFVSLSYELDHVTGVCVITRTARRGGQSFFSVFIGTLRKHLMEGKQLVKGVNACFLIFHMPCIILAPAVVLKTLKIVIKFSNLEQKHIGDYSWPSLYKETSHLCKYPSFLLANQNLNTPLESLNFSARYLRFCHCI